MRAEDEADVWIAFFDTLGDVFLLHHAAAQGNEDFRAAALQIFKRADIPKHAVFRMLADGARIKQDQIRLLGVLREGKPHLQQHALDVFAVGDILLTAICVHECKRDFAALACFENLPQLLDRLAIGPGGRK